MRTTTARWLGRASILLALLGALGGCSTHPAPPISAPDLQLAREFSLYTSYWVGRSFHGIDLTAADAQRDYDPTIGMRVYYGNCRKPSSILSTGGCRLPLEIATVLYKAHTNEGLGARTESVIRGVPAVTYDNGSSIELYTGRVAIDIYAGSPSLARAAAEALLPLNGAAPPTQVLAPPRFPPGTDPRVKAIADGLRPVAQAAHPPKRG